MNSNFLQVVEACWIGAHLHEPVLYYHSWKRQFLMVFLSSMAFGIAQPWCEIGSTYMRYLFQKERGVSNSASAGLLRADNWQFLFRVCAEDRNPDWSVRIGKKNGNKKSWNAHFWSARLDRRLADGYLCKLLYKDPSEKMGKRDRCPRMGLFGQISAGSSLKIRILGPWSSRRWLPG